jgi:Secretion system C-terminal sorting domain/Immune inhibitor A-like, MAM domain
MRRNIVLFLTLALFVVFSAMATTPVEVKRASFNDGQQQAGIDELDVVVYSEDFEGDVSDWIQVSPDIQPNYWFTDDFMAAGGTNAWRCADYGFGDPATGGYADDWLQFMISPAMDFSGVTSASLDFNFSGVLEGGNWDGANVWVFYGNDPGTLAKEIATPTSPAYNDPDAAGFGIWFGAFLPAYPVWAGESGMDWNNAFVPATFDLSGYAGYSYVHVVFAFCSDTAYNSGDNTDMYGFIVDDIVVDADGTTVWADDADGTNVGGPATYETGAIAAGTPVLPFQVEVADVGIWGPAPSPTNVAGVFSDADAAFSHYLEGPEFDLPTIDPGESLWLDLMFNSDIEYLNAFPDEFVWRPEIWNPMTNGWTAAATTGNYVYVGGNGSIWEPFSTSGFTYDWDMSAYAGMEGVRLRIYFSAPAVPRTMTHHLIDDMLIDLQSLQHDLSTMLTMPYPTSVGTDVYGKVTLTNNAPNDEAGFMAVWDYNGLVYPLVPGGPYSLTAGNSLELSIDDPTDPGNNGFWVPTAVGYNAIDAYHTLATDEIPTNDNFPVDVDVLASDMYECGTDSRNFYGSLSVHYDATGPVVHLTPEDVNSDYFAAGGTFDIAELRMDGFFHSAAGGAPAGCTMDFYVYAGGAAPGAVLYTGTYTFTEAVGYLGYTQAILNTSGEAALEGMSGDFWVEARLTTPGGGGYWQPFAYRTGPNGNEATQYYDMADAMLDEPIADFGHHVTAVLTNLSTPAASLFLTPTSSTDLPAGGGTLNYDVNFVNNTGGTFNGVDYWETAILPNSNETGALGAPLSFNAMPFMNATIGRSATVPGGAPNGTYTFVGHVGYYPQMDYTQGTFTFTKGGVVAGGSDEWSVDGESFGIAGDGSAVVVPEAFELGQAYPNPFNPTTSISISLPEVANLKVTVFNTMGQQVAVLANDSYNAGVHTLTFDGANMASGLYFIQAQVPGQLNELRKVTLLK